MFEQSNTPRRYASVEVEDQQTNLIEQLIARIDIPQGKQIYARRLASVEPVFANIRVQKHPHGFTLRSKAKADVQWKMLVLVHNIGKIYNDSTVQ